MKRSRRKKLNYGWVILGLIFGNLFVEGGVRNTQPVLLPALRNNFGGSAAMTAAVFSASGIVSGFTAPMIGRILDAHNAFINVLRQPDSDRKGQLFEETLI